MSASITTFGINNILPDFSKIALDPFSTVVTLAALPKTPKIRVKKVDHRYLPDESGMLQAILRKISGESRDSLLLMEVHIQLSSSWYQPKINPAVKKIFQRAISSLNWMIKHTYGDSKITIEKQLAPLVKNMIEACDKGIPYVEPETSYDKRVKEAWDDQMLELTRIFEEAETAIPEPETSSHSISSYFPWSASTAKTEEYKGEELKDEEFLIEELEYKGLEKIDKSVETKRTEEYKLLGDELPPLRNFKIIEDYLAERTKVFLAIISDEFIKIAKYEHSLEKLKKTK